MNIVFGVLLIWLGAALVYVATHGIEGGGGTPMDVWQQILRDVTGQHGGN